ncbi:Protein PTST homolog 3, chloroplastic [Linum grandiflorum]
MATLCKLHSCLPSFPSRTKLFFSNDHRHRHSPPQCDGLFWNIHHDDRHPFGDRSLVCACSLKSSRVKRKVKSNEELRDDIKEFLLAVGLPEDHVPSRKELIDNGRIDLANIVRRRGHKQIRELLANSSKLEVDDQSSDKECTSNHEPCGFMEGCYEKGNNETGDSTDQNSDPLESTVDSLSENHGWENEVLQRTTPDFAPSFSSPPESELEDESVGAQKDDYVSSIDVDDWSSRETPFSDEDQTDQNIHLNLRSIDEFQVPVESSISSSFTFGSGDSKDVGEHSWQHVDSKDDISLEDKVAEFIHTGELDTIDGLSHGAALTANGKAPMNDDSSAYPHSQSLSNLHKDDVETNTSEIQIEINDLKLLLQEKELELNQLKEQIEKETLILSDLQTKAEIEITKAQQLIVEKDAELLAVEESLSDLVEVTIQYRGEGQCVEVAGSFNGWHHKIMMDSDADPDTSSSAEKIKEPRKASIWSTTLWLYPGVYEVKFIVDGEWRNDDHMESVTQGGISNNILRVSR